jgi:small subunit ribosomal protein S14
MATKAQVAKTFKHQPKFSTRKVNRCWRCGRRHGYLRTYGVCRICFRELANRGELPGVTKSSW